MKLLQQKHFSNTVFLLASVSALTACQSMSSFKNSTHSSMSGHGHTPTLEEVQIRNYHQPKNVNIDEFITKDSSQFGYGKQYHSSSLETKKELVNSLDDSKKNALSEVNDLQKEVKKEIKPAKKMNKKAKSELTHPSFDTRQDLVSEARKNSKKAIQSQKTEKPLNVPAFKKMMKMGIKQLKNNQLDEANHSFTKAQRIIPSSSAVYFYLGQVALKQNKPRKAEAFARKALNLANHKKQKRALWKLILQSAKMSGKKESMLEATKALK
ncbi:MAG: tetratricopeptide repeat protein [Moraxellaceae bacterium]|nr:tetratricopeptide repeat protein [Moraxellaceae bacterium]